MENGTRSYSSGLVVFAGEDADREAEEWLEKMPGVRVVRDMPEQADERLLLKLDDAGLALTGDGQVLHADFKKLLSRIRRNNLSGELLVRAAKIRGKSGVQTVLDATAGLGEDSFLLAASGFSVLLYERDPVISLMLKDALRRAAADPDIAQIAGRMRLFEEDSVAAMRHLAEPPDVILLDPMFPARQKSSLIKKKFQLLQHLEQPCRDENDLMEAAVSAGPRRIVIKRPLKGPYLAGRKPDFIIRGNSIRYDCIVPAQPDKETPSGRKT